MTQTAQAPQPTDLDQLAFELTRAKKEENVARHRRIAIEARILSMLPLKEEGTTTEVGSFYKAKATSGFNRKITEALELANLLGPEMFEQVVRTKYELNLSSFKKLPELVRQNASKFIESTPKKPSISVEEISLS